MRIRFCTEWRDSTILLDIKANVAKTNDEEVDKIKEADVVVIGSPVYWHNICGSVRNLLDRFYGPVSAGSMRGKTLYFLYQGAAPEKWMLDAGEYTMSQFAALYGFEWGGMATTTGQAKK